jgi:hypothetical protein
VAALAMACRSVSSELTTRSWRAEGSFDDARVYDVVGGGGCGE